MANVVAQTKQMQDSGIGPDSFVVVMCDRGLPFWIELLAAWVIGAKPICVEAKLTDEHALSVLSMTNVGFIIGADDNTTAEFEALARVPSTFDADLSSDDMRGDFDALPFASDADLPDIAGLIFTSGTTGLPKGVPLTHRALNANALATAQRLNLSHDSRLLIATPFRFISSISHFIVTLLSDAAFFGVEKPMMIKDLLGVLNDLEITAFGGSPFHMQFIAMAGKGRLPHLRWAMSSGDHLRPAVIDQLLAQFDDLELHVVYGMAELGGRFCELPPAAAIAKKGSVGYPVNGFEVAVRREDGTLCDTGEIGNIYVTGLLEFSGYFSNPKANAKVLSPLGFENGDKGYLDEDGYLFLSGRSDSVFKRSGLKVSAQVISDALMGLDAIQDVFVTSELNDTEGRVPRAYLCWKGDNTMEAQDLTRALRALIPVNHIPAGYTVLPTIPRTGSGKVDRRKLAVIVQADATPLR
jgi:acyl-coenzyme A synthetase/AMP-(fatty) acid ligase